jgi:hypothetical protein
MQPHPGQHERLTDVSNPPWRFFMHRFTIRDAPYVSGEYLDRTFLGHCYTRHRIALVQS